MRFILRWLIRFFGIFVFTRGCWLLASEWRVHRLSLHRLGGDFSDLHDTLYFAGNFVVQSSFLLALSGFLIILLAFRR